MQEGLPPRHPRRRRGVGPAHGGEDRTPAQARRTRRLDPLRRHGPPRRRGSRSRRSVAVAQRGEASAPSHRPAAFARYAALGGLRCSRPRTRTAKHDKQIEIKRRHGGPPTKPSACTQSGFTTDAAWRGGRRPPRAAPPCCPSPPVLPRRTPLFSVVGQQIASTPPVAPPSAPCQQLLFLHRPQYRFHRHACRRQCFRRQLLLLLLPSWATLSHLAPPRRRRCPVPPHPTKEKTEREEEGEKKRMK